MHNSMVSICELIFVENLTKEQYSGNFLPRLSMFSVTRDALNPRMNTEVLRQRLHVIDHYKFRYGAQHTYWVHFALKKYGQRVWTYKFNYLFKGALAYATWRKVQAYNKADSENFLSEVDRTVNYRLPFE